jgi:TolA-binding protein
MVENELKLAEQAYRTQKQNLDRNDCYEYFLFSKTLRKTRRCVDLANQADDTRQKIDDLEIQLQQLQGSQGRSYQDEIVRELARHDCGANYQQQARREPGGSSGFWEDEESSSGGGGSFGRLPYATYRTVCVRLCDGYYFPVSFATLPNHFQRDEEVCHSKCAAPAALYYHQNPGAGMEQAVEARSNAPYTELKSAFRYRKEYVNGCSCKMAEFKPEPGSVNPANDAQGWVSTETPTGSTEAQPPPPAQTPPPAQQPEGGEQLPWSTAP